MPSISQHGSTQENKHFCFRLGTVAVLVAGLALSTGCLNDDDGTTTKDDSNGSTEPIGTGDEIPLPGIDPLSFQNPISLAAADNGHDNAKTLAVALAQGIEMVFEAGTNAAPNPLEGRDGGFGGPREVYSDPGLPRESWSLVFECAENAGTEYYELAFDLDVDSQYYVVADEYESDPIGTENPDGIDITEYCNYTIQPNKDWEGENQTRVLTGDDALEHRLKMTSSIAAIHTRKDRVDVEEGHITRLGEVLTTPTTLWRDVEQAITTKLFADRPPMTTYLVGSWKQEIDDEEVRAHGSSLAISQIDLSDILEPGTVAITLGDFDLGATDSGFRTLLLAGSKATLGHGLPDGVIDFEVVEDVEIGGSMGIKNGGVKLIDANGETATLTYAYDSLNDETTVTIEAGGVTGTYGEDELVEHSS